jgi:hypothetical protein
VGSILVPHLTCKMFKCFKWIWSWAQNEHQRDEVGCVSISEARSDICISTHSLQNRNNLTAFVELCNLTLLYIKVLYFLKDVIFLEPTFRRNVVPPSTGWQELVN